MLYRQLMSLAVALAAAVLPAGAAVAPTDIVATSTLSCQGFTKNANGSWHAGANTKPFDAGTARHFTITNSDIGPNFFNIGGVDLYALVEAKCGKSKTRPPARGSI